MLEFENGNAPKDNSRIEDILKKSEADIKEGRITRKSGESGKEEFLFSADGTGLVFDAAKVASEPAIPKEESAESFARKSLLDFEKNAPRVEEVTLVASEESETVAVEPPAAKEEFSLPSSFTVDERYNTPISEERRPIFATYVPKFTEVSENFTMASQPRPPRKPAAVADAEPAEAKDPTAEEEGETLGAVIVGNGDAPASSEAILNVAKPAPRPAAAVPEPTVEDEKKKIGDLLANPLSAPVAASEKAPASVAEASAPLNPVQEPAVSQEGPFGKTEEYVIPDPEEATVRVFDYPEDIGASSLPSQPTAETAAVRKGFFAPKEYENVAQKMAFKDMFLDRLNSVAVRLGAAVLLTIVLLFLENMHLFGFDAVAFLGFEGYPFLLVLLDLQVVLCLFLLAMPEIMRGVRALTKGMFHSELFLPVAFLLQAIQTVGVMFAAPSVEGLYGFVFGLASIATIVGAYLRHYASFLTFRHVGGRDEKIAAEKKMTRLLDKEKFALDGAVDEYKSKTVRFTRANFISDFFARERKSAESTRYNLKYLLVSLGISFVCAVVMFFVGENGMLDAATALTLTFYLSAPAALLLCHRLPYYFSVLLASSEGGGVIGETSHLEYAGVDVVSFKDTEVFEKGNVVLKHLLLYDPAKEFTSVVEQMSSLFSVIGGSLDTLFSAMLVKKVSAADEAVLENGGIYGRIGSTSFHVGNADYMISKGIELRKDKETSEMISSVEPNTKIMYAAENGRIYATLCLQYRLSSSFEALLSEFAEENIVSLVYTKDFNITNDLMRYLAKDRDVIRVLRDDETGEDAVQEKLSVGLVAKDKESAISLLLLCHRYAKLQKTLVSAFWFVLGSGLFLGSMLAAFGLLSVLPSVAYGAFQIALIVAMAIYVSRSLDGRKKKNEGDSVVK